MPVSDPITAETSEGRQFACFPAAVLVALVAPEQRVLLLRSPTRWGGWEVSNGALEHGETVLQGCLRELAEEAGSTVRARPLGVVHVQTIVYDTRIPPLLSICYVMEYLGGDIVPGDDMAGSEWRWFTIDEILARDLQLDVPGEKWVVQRAVELYGLWHDRRVPPLDAARQLK